MTKFGECGGCPTGDGAQISPNDPGSLNYNNYDPTSPDNEIHTSEIDRRFDIPMSHEVIRGFSDVASAVFDRIGWWWWSMSLSMPAELEIPGTISMLLNLVDDDGSSNSVELGRLNRVDSALYYADPSSVVQYDGISGLFNIVGSRVVFPKLGTIWNATNNIVLIQRPRFRFRFRYQVPDWLPATISFHAQQATFC